MIDHNDDWRVNLRTLADRLREQQKNTKGDPHKGDSLENFRGKKGFNDTGIPLSPKAAKKQQHNRSSYRYPTHLQRINDRRKKDAMDRHGITDPTDPYNLNKKKASLQPAERRNYSSTWGVPMAPTPREKLYVYYDAPSTTPPEKITYIVPYEPEPAPAYKAKVITTNGKIKFKNKLEEAIYNHPNYSKQKF